MQSPTGLAPRYRDQEADMGHAARAVAGRASMSATSRSPDSFGGDDQAAAEPGRRRERRGRSSLHKEACR